MKDAPTKLSRRAFLRTAAFASLVPALAACGAQAPAPGTNGAPGTVATRELSMIGWSNPAIPELLGQFEKDTSIKVKYDVFPTKWDDVMQKFTLWGQTGYSGIDVMFADDLIGGMWSLNGWAEDLSKLDAYTKHKDDLVEGITTLNTAINGVYRAFFMLDLMPFFYNKDMVSKPPTTWNELVSVGQQVTKADAGVWGWRPTNGEGHAFNTVLMMLNQSGANLNMLDDPATLEALTFMEEWVQVQKITPASTVSEDNTIVESLAASNKAGMWWTYGGGYGNALKIDKTTLTPQNLMYARFPKGPASDVGLVHGWGLMIPKASKQKEMASELVNWWARPELIRDLDVKLFQPPYKSLFQDKQLVEQLPILTASVGWEEILRGAKFREPIVTSPQVTQIWNMFQNLGKYVFSGQKSPAQAQQWVVGEYKTIKGGG